MKKYQQLLAGLLLVQILLVVVLAVFGHQSQTDKTQPLLAAPQALWDKVVIAEANQQVELHKQNGQWQLPHWQGLPADKEKLNDLLAKLDQLSLHWPVTSTPSSHERFEVTDKKFQRKISYYQGDKKLGEFFLGTTPGFKQIHLRKAGDNNVYVVELSSMDFPTTPMAWLSHELLTVKGLKAIKAADYEITRTDQGWMLQGLKEGEKVSANALTTIADTFAQLQPLGVADKTFDSPEFELQVTGDQGVETFSFVQSEGSDYVKTSSRPQWFMVSKALYDKLQQIHRQDLLEKPPADNANKSADKSVGKNVGKNVGKVSK